MMSDNGPSTLEILPNELLLGICKHFTARELYRAFYGLNRRFRSIVDNISNLHLTMTENEFHEPIWLAFRRVIKLSVDRVEHIDLCRFSNIRSLEWISPFDAQTQQLYSSTYFAHLDHLSVYNMRDTLSTAYFHQFIFSNGFPLVSKCNLNRVNISLSWTLSPYLRAVSIGSVSDPLVFERILISCPNLTRFDFHLLGHIRIPPPSTFQHVNLKRLYLTGTLSSQLVSHIAARVPALVLLNVGKWILREKPIIYFQHLSNIFNAFLPYLSQFDCDFVCNGEYDHFRNIGPILEQLHPCFTHRLQFTKLDYNRIRISTK